MRSFLLAGALILALVASAAPVRAQGVGTQGATEWVTVEPRAESETRAFGTASTTAHVVGALSFLPPSSATGFAINASIVTGIAVFQTTAAGDWWAPLHLPAGALVERIELEACDDNVAEDIAFGLARGTAPGGATQNLTPAGTTTASPGCAFFPLSLIAPVTIDNRTNNYWLFLNYGATDATTRVQGIRVFYRLQVSPAPAVATFPSDVPTSHPFFRFIEALARAGITSGCGAGSYCPDSAVTRGQMAVFLSIALGLHFPDP
jgi:hypothetical protein